MIFQDIRTWPSGPRCFSISIFPKILILPIRRLNIQDFWRRWHMTLSGWLRDYLFIPLGGSRGGGFNTYRNLMITFVLVRPLARGGMDVHFLGSDAWRWPLSFTGYGRGSGYKMPKFPAWVLTFLFLNTAWVLFQGTGFARRLSPFFQAWLYFGRLHIRSRFEQHVQRVCNLIPGRLIPPKCCPGWSVFQGLPLLPKTPISGLKISSPSFRWAFIALVLLLMGMPDFRQPSEFLYFNF